ncbi:conserved hypothetical protein [Nitrosococcus oceani ATCC 19707]|uniref:Na+/H+ antiporter MnhB subunit-related protein domain-containing protein n=3 Tax=Nitrosococcus oceani TaxID=1229 RepID=Q3JBL3_NITOC|nr:conserved hypothetical protein [Nitrosococcus oceani ATCC 19707]KFI19800.1 hypothetical protein IB75_06690 [Nitrosococcus oceani C-27]
MTPNKSRLATTTMIDPYRIVLLSLLLVLMAILIRGVMDLAPIATGLGPMVFAAKEPGGEISPVTAVLLLFRDYDTLLELAVLLLALIGVWSFGEAPPPPSPSPPGPILLDFLRLVLPLMALAFFYLVWAGGSAAGGAFQGGAMLGTIGALFRLSNLSEIPLPPEIWLRLAAALGIAIFLTVAMIPLVGGDLLLAVSPQWMKTKILWLEFPAALSIGVILAALFAGGQPRRHTNNQP